MTDDTSAAVRYKEIMGLARKAAENLREWEQRRAEELESQIAATAERVERLEEAQLATQERALRWWRMACDNVARLPWLEPGEPPSPSHAAGNDRPDGHTEEIRTAYRELTNAVDALGWRARR